MTSHEAKTQLDRWNLGPAAVAACFANAGPEVLEVELMRNELRPEVERAVFTATHAARQRKLLTLVQELKVVGNAISKAERTVARAIEKKSYAEGVAASSPILLHETLAREEKVAGALARAGSGTLDDLVPLAYDDVKPGLFPVAKRSLLAHLLKLETDGRAARDRERWFPR